MEQQKTPRRMECDLVVIGTGAGGLPAAIAAYEAGVKRIIMLEKLNIRGGNALKPAIEIYRKDGGGEGRPIEKGMGEKDYKNAMSWNHGRGTPKVIRALANQAEHLPEWFEDKLQLFVPMEKSDEPGKDREYGAVPRVLFPWIDRYEIPIYCNTPAKKILKDEQGRVCGVLAQDAEGEINISCKAAVIATGGYIRNPELMKRFWHSYTDTFYQDAIFDGFPHTGDGALMAEDAGVRLIQNSGVVEWVAGRHKCPNHIRYNWTEADFLGSLTTSILVDESGRRFENEKDDEATNTFLTLPHYTAYHLMDQAMIDNIESGRLEARIPPPPENDGPGGPPPEQGDPGRETEAMKRHEPPPMQLWHEPGNPQFPHAAQSIREDMERGAAYICSTLDEMAAWIGCKPETLKQTVQRWNHFCEIGKDEDFLRNPATMVPFSGEGPYYCMKQAIQFILTRGPISVDEHMNTQDLRGDPIPGLYAAGVDIAGTDTDCYAGNVPCHSIYWSVSSGIIAGRSIAAYIQG